MEALLQSTHVHRDPERMLDPTVGAAETSLEMSGAADNDVETPVF